MRPICVYIEDIINTRDFINELYDSRYSDIFENIDRLSEKPRTDPYERNSAIRTAYRGLYDTGLM